MSIDRLPPHSEEAERAVLGAVFLDPDAAIPECVTKIGDKVDVFYDLRHRTIYSACISLYDLGMPVDSVTLYEFLAARNEAEAVGGVSYLAGIPDDCPSASNVSQYLDILLAKYRSRSLIQLTATVCSSVYDDESSTPVLIESTTQQLMDMASQSAVVEEEPVQALVHRAIDQIESWHQHQGFVTGIASGFSDLDKLTTGFHGGEMIVIAGRPGLGKSTIAGNIVEHTCIDLALPAGVFSLEMTRLSWVLRMLASRARVNLRGIMDGFLAERDFPKLVGAAGRIMHAPIHINDRSGLSIVGLRTRAKRMHQQHGIRLLVVDYLQLLSSPRRGGDSRETEVAAISNGLKTLAKELDIPVIVLCQLNRGIEKDGSRRPRLADLRESGAIEQDADFVGILYRSKSYDDDGQDENSDWTAVDLEVCKQRNGPIGTIHFTFLRAYTRFESAARVSSDDTDSTQYSPPYSDQEPTVEQGQML